MVLEVLDDSELKPKRSYTEAYKIIPDHIYTKKWVPLAPTVLWNLQFYDWDEYEYLVSGRFDEHLVRLFRKRMEDGLSLDRALDEGKIKRKSETMVYWGYPPNLTIRADLHSSSSVMIYGPSHDISFCGINDITREGRFAYNIHMEDGYPTDFWFVFPDDEALDRRHMKLGYKMKEMPKRYNDLPIAASKIRDIMMDIRNERSPEHALSSFQVSVFYMMVGGVTKFSNWDALGQIYDGVNAKSLYNLPHFMFGYEPWPPMLNTFFALDRDQWCISLSRMLSMNQLYLQHVDKGTMDYVYKHFPEEFHRLLLSYSYQLKKIGIPLPAQTMKCIPPKYNSTSGEWERLEFEYPKGLRIFYEDPALDLSFDEATSGILFNLTHKTKNLEKVTQDHIISIGHGMDTKYLKPEGWIEEEKRKKRLRRKVKKVRKVIRYKKDA
ncbi:MAG: hypothetical protein HWN67_07745 [Candidatus Helarchaeota archaeon]|nr:hypothetical protein [Candidatus Helarchaeota archaeon]